MKDYFDSSVLVGAVLARHPQHKICAELFEAVPDKITCAHTLAEVFATLTGSYKVPNDIAATQTLRLCDSLDVSPLMMEDYKTAIAEARQRGVMGGGLYDSLHAVFARRRGAKRIFSLNATDFKHVAPDLEIVIP
jgi:predicted nucleic acid-binding protein